MMQPCERTSDSVRQPVKTETENRASTDLKGEITMKKIYSAAELEHIANERRKDAAKMSLKCFTVQVQDTLVVTCLSWRS